MRYIIMIVILVKASLFAFCQNKDTLHFKFFKGDVKANFADNMGLIGLNHILDSTTFNKVFKKVHYIFKEQTVISDEKDVMTILLILDDYLSQLPEKETERIMSKLFLWKEIYQLLALTELHSRIYGYPIIGEGLDPYITRIDVLLTMPDKNLPKIPAIKRWLPYRKMINKHKPYYYVTNSLANSLVAQTDVELVNYLVQATPEVRYDFFISYFKQVRVLLNDLRHTFPEKNKK